MKLYCILSITVTAGLFFARSSFGQNPGLPELTALYPLNKQYGTTDISKRNNPPGKERFVELAPGNYGQPAGSYLFSGTSSSFVELPNNGGLDARYSMTFVSWIRPEDSTGPLLSYRVNNKDGVRVWLERPNVLAALFETRNLNLPFSIKSNKIRLESWNYVAASYDNSTGTMKLWIDGREVSSLNVGQNELATQGEVRIGAVPSGSNFYKGRIACVQIYNKSLSEQELKAVRDRCLVEVPSRHVGCYADKTVAAIPSLEGKDPLLDGDPKTREDALQKCARVAFKLGYVFFAIKDGGHCLSSLTAQDTYNKYGLSTDCQDGNGGKMASDVYEIIMFRYQTCWNGWSSKGDSCFKLYDDKKTWADAEAVCNAERGTLAKLNSQDKSYFVFLHLIKPANPSSGVWMGLFRDVNMKFYWSDGTAAEPYTNWAQRSPDTSPGNKKNCSKLDVFTGLWEDEEFDFTFSFVCGRVIPATPRDVRVHLMDSHSARVMWSTSEQSQGHVASYYIEYKVKNYDEVQLKVIQNQNITSLTGLQSHAVYEVRVRAVNGAGGGMWSHYETFSTGETYPPRINPFEPIRALVPGEDLILTCTARGGPEPTITWYKDRKLIHKNRTLVITNQASAMEGLYTCRASNGIQPDDIASVTVTSLATPVLKHAWGTAYEGELYLKQGARLSLNCEIANTIAEITWYKGDDPLPSQRYSSKSVIDIQKTSADDFGVYECKAKNSLGVASKKIKVVNAEQLTRLNIVIGCLASLLFILFVAFAIVVCLLHKARKVAASKKEVEEEDDPLPTLSGPRPSDHDFKIPEVRSTGSPKIPSTGNKPSYTPLNTVDSPNGGTSITIETTKF